MAVSNYLKVKESIIETCKEITRLGLVYASWGNISAAVDRGFFITPSGVNHLDTKLEDLILVSYQGEILEGEKKPSIESQLHRKIYNTRSDVGAIIHTHSTYASAFAISHEEIPAIMEDMVQIIKGDVKLVDYSLPGSNELAENTANLLKETNAVLLPNHGIVTVGKDLEKAIKANVLIERCAKSYIYSKIVGEPKKIPDEDFKKLKEMY